MNSTLLFSTDFGRKTAIQAEQCYQNFSRAGQHVGCDDSPAGKCSERKVDPSLREQLIFYCLDFSIFLSEILS
jgi:hypothetical protein